jgi:hypothetical protein
MPTITTSAREMYAPPEPMPSKLVKEPPNGGGANNEVPKAEAQQKNDKPRPPTETTGNTINTKA